MRVDINPEVIRWARNRAGRTVEDLEKRFPRLDRWEHGEERPTLKQVERFAKAVNAPVGYLFLQEPLIESLPIPDFRTFGNLQNEHPSPNLLDTIYICQERQEWYHNFARSTGEEKLSFVGSANIRNAVETTATTIRNALGFDMEKRRRIQTWTDALRLFIEQADTLGILVMCSGIVLNNTHRHLNSEEFRGFALTDDLAPLIFINGADSKAAQMFTLAHELAHIWLGQSAVSDAQALELPEMEVERWCNQVAAELLVPLDLFRNEFNERAEISDEANRLARRFKVSTLVILRRMHDAGKITRTELWEAYEQEIARIRAISRGSGGDFYLTQAARVSKRFARALIESTLEGQTLHRDAFRMLGFSKLKTFHELGRNLGVLV